MTIEKWGLFEVSVKGPSDGNPFTEHHIEGVFTGAREQIRANGFYDGNGDYRVRFMPSYEGDYTYTVTADFLSEPACGTFSVTAPSPQNHGPVSVAWKYHFTYADSTPYYSVGTTCYAFLHQSDERIAQTLTSLEEAGFNKIRFCIFPKHFTYNLKEPCMYPYEGTPMDSSVLTEENYEQYNGEAEGNHFDKFRFNTAFFRHVERCISELQKRGVEADIIMMHPYDRWGFTLMSKEEDDLYWNYCVARFSAYRNVWWSLANEFDLLTAKTLADWERYAQILLEKDPYGHLRSIHNSQYLYDHNRPWVTHCSIQLDANLTSKFRQTYGKPIVMDEICYEGDVPQAWGSITGESMLCRCWETVMRGGYPGHGETYLGHDDALWWSHGGKLYGESHKRMRFLLDLMKETPGHGLKLEKDMWGFLIAAPEREYTDVKSYYLCYFGERQPRQFIFKADDTTPYRVQRIDTWNMTVEDLGIFRGRMEIPLTGKPYMALRLIKAE